MQGQGIESIATERRLYARPVLVKRDRLAGVTAADGLVISVVGSTD